jgi:hypothetical protein
VIEPTRGGRGKGRRYYAATAAVADQVAALRKQGLCAINLTVNLILEGLVIRCDAVSFLVAPSE